MLGVYFDELAKKRRKDANPNQSRGLVAGPGEVVVTEEEIDEDE